MKELKEIFLNVNNVKEYQEENVHSYQGGICLGKHMELNSALCECLGDRYDWGGRYASWLNNISVEHQTDTGWWNETAVCRDNLLAFIEYQTCDDEGNDMLDEYNTLKALISGLSPMISVKMKTEYVSVREMIKPTKRG